MKNKNILKLRKKIDSLDKKIVNYLEKRLKIAQKIIFLKEKSKLEVTDKKREEEVLEKLKIFTQNPLLKANLQDIYEIIFKLSKTSYQLKKNKIEDFKKISIVGLGLIGGSIAKGLKFINPKIEIYTLDRKDKDILLAEKEKILSGKFSLKDLVSKSELIILALPIESILPLAKEISQFDFKDKKIIIDVGSIKEKIVKDFEKLNKENLDFIGTHPMAGSEKSGFENAKVDLFLNYPWIITPHKLNKKENIRKIKKLVSSLGSKPLITKAKTHDLIVARVSHLIFLISKLLFIYSYEKNKNWLKFAGTGFQTTTRLTSANPLMHYQIFSNNYENIKKELESFIDFAEKFKISPENSYKIFKKYKTIRDKIFS